MINTDQPQDITERLNDIDERLKQYIYTVAPPTGLIMRTCGCGD
jgi:hypothetical protein